jgi:hypothetical protein
VGRLNVQLHDFGRGAGPVTAAALRRTGKFVLLSERSELHLCLSTRSQAAFHAQILDPWIVRQYARNQLVVYVVRQTRGMHRGFAYAHTTQRALQDVRIFCADSILSRDEARCIRAIRGIEVIGFNALQVFLARRVGV